MEGAGTPVTAPGSSGTLFNSHPLCWPHGHLKPLQRQHIYVFLRLLKNVL